MRRQTEEARKRAEVKSEKLLVARRDGAKATADYEARQQAVLDRTARLRAARLVKEEADGEAPPARRQRSRRKATAH